MSAISVLVALLVVVLIVAVLVWAFDALATVLGLPPTITVIMRVILVLIALVYLLQMLGVLGGSARVPRLF